VVDINVDVVSTCMQAVLCKVGIVLYRLPRCRSPIGERAVSCSGPLAWNALRSTLCDIADRTRNKTHFIDPGP